MSSTEQPLVQIRSKRDEGGGLHYRDTQLVIGTGTVVFTEGRAEVPRETWETTLCKNDKLELADGSQPAPAAMTGRGLPPGLVDASDDELDFLAEMLNMLRSHDEWASTIADDDLRAELLSDLRDEIHAEGDTTPEPEPAPHEPPSGPQGDPELPDPPSDPVPDDDPADPPAPPEDDERLAAAKAHLAAEGEHVPKSIPNGFEGTTSEGEPRCYAAKGDGSQCTNPAKTTDHDGATVSTYACGLERHKEQVAKLP